MDVYSESKINVTMQENWVAGHYIENFEFDTRHIAGLFKMFWEKASAFLLLIFSLLLEFRFSDIMLRVYLVLVYFVIVFLLCIILLIGGILDFVFRQQAETKLRIGKLLSKEKQTAKSLLLVMVHRGE